MKEVPKDNPFAYVASDAAPLVSSGQVIVTGGSIKTNHRSEIGVHAKISPDKKLITPYVLIEDLAVTTPDGKMRAYLMFEVASFGISVIQDMPVRFRDVLQSDGGLIYQSAIALAGGIVHSLVWDCCKKIRFNLTPRIVTCSIKLNNNLLLSSVSAFEWSQDEDIAHFFELRRS